MVSALVALSAICGQSTTTVMSFTRRQGMPVEPSYTVKWKGVVYDVVLSPRPLPRASFVYADVMSGGKETFTELKVPDPDLRHHTQSVFKFFFHRVKEVQAKGGYNIELHFGAKAEDKHGGFEGQAWKVGTPEPNVWAQK